jgi:hypothetical protein
VLEEDEGVKAVFLKTEEKVWLANNLHLFCPT